MSRIAVLMFLLTIVPLLTVGGGAPRATASHGGGCPVANTAWSGEASCSFNFRGFPVTVFGEAFASGTAEVLVDVRVPGSPAPLLACTASGNEYATCSADYPPTPIIDTTRPIVTLECHVTGRSSGNYFCLSGLGF